ncbi:hypothetical protein [Arcanobacterium hippocoleae]
MRLRKIVAGIGAAALISAGLFTPSAFAKATYEKLDQSKIKAVLASSEEPAENPNGMKEHTLDGNKNTFWHSK